MYGNFLKHWYTSLACTAVLPEQNEFHLGGGALNDGRGVLVAPPIENLVVNLKCRQVWR